MTTWPRHNYWHELQLVYMDRETIPNKALFPKEIDWNLISLSFIVRAPIHGGAARSACVICTVSFLRQLPILRFRQALTLSQFSVRPEYILDVIWFTHQAGETGPRLTRGPLAVFICLWTRPGHLANIITTYSGTVFESL